MILTALAGLFMVASFGCVVTSRTRIHEALSATASSVGFVGALCIAYRVAKFGVYAPSSYISIDSFGALVLLAVTGVGCATLLYSIPYFREEVRKEVVGASRVRQYYVLVNLFILAMVLTCTVSSPVFAWICIEATTLSTAFLISFYNKPSVVEAAWKYFTVNTIALLLGFFGTLLYFTSFKGVYGDGIVSWQMLTAQGVFLDPLVAKIAFICVLIGYGVKIGLAPLHAWKPDAYSKAPTPLGAMFSGALVPVAFLLLIRFKTITDSVVPEAFTQNLLVVFGVLSIVVAALLAYDTSNYKRLLTYSSIEHGGIMALGFGFGGVGVFAGILHMLYHSFVKAPLFLLSGTIFLRYHTAHIARVRGVLTALPKTSVLFILGFLAVSGIPPFGLFLTKVSILSAGVVAHPLFVVVALLGMTFMLVGFLRNISRMLFGDVPKGIEQGREHFSFIAIPCVLIALVCGASFYVPAWLLTLIHTASLLR